LIAWIGAASAQALPDKIVALKALPPQVTRKSPRASVIAIASAPLAPAPGTTVSPFTFSGSSPGSWMIRGAS
jgi:hypothetical protein